MTLPRLILAAMLLLGGCSLIEQFRRDAKPVLDESAETMRAIRVELNTANNNLLALTATLIDAVKATQAKAGQSIDNFWLLMGIGSSSLFTGWWVNRDRRKWHGKHDDRAAQRRFG